MGNKLSSLWSKYRDIIVYLFFGGLTTIVNYAVYFALYNVAAYSGIISNAVAWTASVIFAYVVNKLFVFESKSWKKEIFVPEFIKFFGLRFFSGLAETLLIFLFVDILNFNGNITKLILSVFVVIANYIFSKIYVFKK